MAKEKSFDLQVNIEAVDKYSPIFKKIRTVMGLSKNDIDQTTKSFKNLGSSSQDVNKINKSLKDMQGYENGIKKLNDGLSTMKETIVGLGFAYESTKALKELFGLAKEAGNIQMKNIEIGGIYGLDETSKQLQDINKQANDLSNKTLFSTKDILDINAQLGHAQVALQNLEKVVPQATYLAEMEVGIGKSGSASSTAYNFARMSEDAGITNDSSKMADFADKMYRVLNVTHATSESLGETFKMAMVPGKLMGWNQNDMLEAAAYAAVNGMEGTMAGTHIKDFVERANPLKPDIANNQKILAALNMAGLISGVSTSVGKTGKIEITGFKEAALMKDKDHMESFADMVATMTSKHDEFIAENGNKASVTSSMSTDDVKALKSHIKELTGQDMFGGELEWAALMNRIFGEQGQDFAILATHKDRVDKLNQSLERQASLEDQAIKVRGSFIGQLHVLESNIQNLGISIGNQVLPELTNGMKELAPMVANMKDWVENHKELAKKIVEVTAGIGTFILALEGAKLAFKSIDGLVVSPLKKAVSGFIDILNAKKFTKAAASESLMDIQANVVNLYGAEINAPGGGGISIGGGSEGKKPASGGKIKRTPAGSVTTVATEVVASEAVTAVENAAKSGSLRKVGQTAAKTIGAGLKSVKTSLPVAIAMGAYDVVTAPEGKKVETAVKSSGDVMGGWAGAAMGAELGATLGSVVPGLGTAIGGVLGGIIGGIAGSIAGNKIAEGIYNAVRKTGYASYDLFKAAHPNVDAFHVADTINKYSQYGNSYGVLADPGAMHVTLNPLNRVDPSLKWSTPGTLAQKPLFAAHANGGIFDRAHFGVVAEAGPEAIIPLSNKSRGMAIWQQAGQALGVPRGGGGGDVHIHPGAIQINGADRQAGDIVDEFFRRMGTSTRQMNMSRPLGPNRLVQR